LRHDPPLKKSSKSVHKINLLRYTAKLCQNVSLRLAVKNPAGRLREEGVKGAKGQEERKGKKKREGRELKRRTLHCYPH